MHKLNPDGWILFGTLVVARFLQLFLLKMTCYIYTYIYIFIYTYLCTHTLNFTIYFFRAHVVLNLDPERVSEKMFGCCFGARLIDICVHCSDVKGPHNREIPLYSWEI